MRKLLIVVALAGLAGCTTTGAPDPLAAAKGVVTVCDTFNSVLTVANTLDDAHKLNESQRLVVSNAVIDIKPLCGPGSVLPTDPMTAVLEIGTATNSIQMIVNQVKGVK